MGNLVNYTLSMATVDHTVYSIKIVTILSLNEVHFT